MNEVTNQNFKEIYPQLERTLRNAGFIAIDTEFTGIEVNGIKNSLFDTVQERYDKQRSSIQQYTIIQFGITTFHHVQDENRYNAQAFNFFLSPRSVVSQNKQFLWHISAFQFLAMYKFDFNKVAYYGIPYLDDLDQATLQQKLQENTLLSEERCLSYEEEDELKDCINQVSEWLKTASDETSSLKINASTPIIQYVMHKELRSYFPSVWTISGNDLITVMKVSPDVRKVLGKQEGSILEDVLLDSYTGFSKVFNLLVSLKKPIIAHNASLDLMFMYQQFYRPLPKKYIDFKNSLHQLFPTIYDTKFLSFKLKEYLCVEERWKNNSLSGLFDYFTESHGKHLVLGSPIIKLNCETDLDESTTGLNSIKYHTAGWDSYISGYVFIKMAHVFAAKHFSQGITIKYFTHTEIMNGIKKFANCINIIRGNTPHLRLDGPDPVSTRPKWLYVRTLASKPVTAAQIAVEMSTFGAVDVKQFTPKRVLVAVANHGSARDILRHFKENKKLYVVPYNPIRHSPSVQLVLWSSIVLSGGIVAWVLHQKAS